MSEANGGMRSPWTVLRQLFITLFMLFLIATAVLVVLIAGGDVYLASVFAKSAVVRHFPYANVQKTDETAFFRQAFPANDLAKGRLEARLREDHGFECRDIASVPHCRFVVRGALNCLRSISLELHFAGDERLASVEAQSYVGCDG